MTVRSFHSSLLCKDEAGEDEGGVLICACCAGVRPPVEVRVRARAATASEASGVEFTDLREGSVLEEVAEEGGAGAALPLEPLLAVIVEDDLILCVASGGPLAPPPRPSPSNGSNSDENSVERSTAKVGFDWPPPPPPVRVDEMCFADGCGCLFVTGPRSRSLTNFALEGE